MLDKMENGTFVKMDRMDHDDLLDYLNNVVEIIQLNNGDIFPSLHSALFFIQEKFEELQAEDHQNEEIEEILEKLEEIV